jgi:amidase/6-aminohexanoate-cyclic-dimer hydrolase
MTAASGALLTDQSPAAEYQQQDGLGLAQLIAQRQITPLELLNAVRARTESVNPKLNAFCQLFFEKAELQIKQGLPNGPFRGVPFLLKDLGHQLAETPTTFASRIYKDYIPNFDSTLIERYHRAGLVIFGKTTTPEMGIAPTTESALYGPTRNPWNLERTPGGSSGGSAAAVASRVVPMAHATDGGGSIRIPASCCGVFGLKPTRGRVPFGPTQLEGWNGLSMAHAVTVSVRDSAALLDCTHGPEIGSPYWAPSPTRPFLKEVGADPGKLRVALMVDPPLGTPLDPECRAAVIAAAKLCESLGHIVEEAKPPLDFSAVVAAFLAVQRVSLARGIEDRGRVLGRAITEKDLESVTWVYYQLGLGVGAVDYSRAIAACQLTGLAVAKFQQNYDVILSPTLGKRPVQLGLLSLSRSDPAAVLRENAEFSPFTRLYNVTGQPAMSVPLHWSPDGLPVGVMFAGRFGDEATLFRLAAQLESACPWVNRRADV